MTTPDWWQALLLALAAWRTFALLSRDTILDGPRNLLCGLPWNWQEDDTVPKTYRRRLGDFVQCGYCLGFWVSVAWWIGWLLSEKWSVVLAVPWAISAVVILIERALDSE